MRSSIALAVVLLVSGSATADSTLTFDGDVPLGGPDHFFVPFDVPAGIAELEIVHTGQSDANILDFGLLDPNGYRGWGGGTSENTVVGLQAASRAYVPGPLPAGQWKVVVGKAKIAASPATYHIVITLRDTATLPPQVDRKPYVPAAPLEKSARYYAVDLHAHSRESTDALRDLGLDEMLSFAASQGLDALEISDHNTITQLDYFSDAQARHPHTLLIPGIEFTTYAGHANAIGATGWVDHKIGQPGVTIEGAAQAVLDQGALFSINHPSLDLGNLCIGCAWKHELTPSKISALEIETGGYHKSGFIFLDPVLTFWEGLLATGRHVPAVGGSDDHHAGVNEGSTSSSIGQPVTLVWAEELSVPAILDGIRNGRTVVKLEDIHDPMIELTSEVPPQGDTIRARSTFFHVRVSGVFGNATLHLVKNGVTLPEQKVTSDPFVYDLAAVAPATGEDRYRAEVLLDGEPHTITSHLFLAGDASGPDPVGQRAGGCAISGTPPSSTPWLVVALALVAVLGLRSRRT